jgi:hypothetical protein
MASSAWPETAETSALHTPEKSADLRWIDWIWTARGEVALPEGQSADEALARIEPVLHEPRTTFERHGDALRYTKTDPAAQDKFSVFEKGTLRIEQGAGGPVLRYRLASSILLFCFLLPALFIAFGQLTLVVGDYQKAAAEAKAKAAPKDAKKDDKKVLELNPIDKMLGAPAPEKPKDGEGGSRRRKPSATAAYILAGIFAFLYIAGRFMEPWLIRRLLRRKLAGA